MACAPWLLAVGELLEQLAPMQVQQDQTQQQTAEKGKNPLPRAVYPNVACPTDECRARAASTERRRGWRQNHIGAALYRQAIGGCGIPQLRREEPLEVHSSRMTSSRDEAGIVRMAVDCEGFSEPDAIVEVPRG